MQPDTLPLAKSTEVKASPLLDLPLEIKQTIYRFFFAMHDVVLRVKRPDALGKYPLQILSNGGVELLLTCRHVYLTAKPSRRLSSVTLDLRQLHGGSSSIPEIAAQLSKACLSSNRLILRQGQTLDAESFALFPQLRIVRIYDYKTFRDRLPSKNHAHLAENFDGEVRKLLKQEAMMSLSLVTSRLRTEIIFVCDCMICPGDSRLVGHGFCGTRQC